MISRRSRGDLLDDMFGVGFEERLFDGVDAFVDLVEDGEDVVDELVDEGVEGVIDAAPEQAFAFGIAGPAALECSHKRLERAVVHSDEVAADDEDVDLAGARDFVARVPKREVHDEEEVVIVPGRAWGAQWGCRCPRG